MAPKAASKKEVAPAQASSPMRWPIYLLFAIGAALIAVYLSAPPSGISAPGPTFLQKIRPAGMLCERTNSPIFTEDIKKDYNTGVVFLSADQHRGKYNTVMGRWNLTAGEKEKGDLWYYDPWKDVDVRRLLPDGFDLEKNDFHPLGIGLHFYPGNQFYFYVINHRRSGGTVELFTLDYHVDDFNASVPTINWVRTIKSPVVNTPNSILAVPPTGDGKLSFYVTNDHFMHNDTFLGRFKFWFVCFVYVLMIICHSDLLCSKKQGKRPPSSLGLGRLLHYRPQPIRRPHRRRLLPPRRQGPPLRQRNRLVPRPQNRLRRRNLGLQTDQLQTRP